MPTVASSSARPANSPVTSPERRCCPIELSASNSVGGKEGLLVGRESEIFRIATAVLLPGELCRKVGDWLAGRGVEDRDLVTNSELLLTFYFPSAPKGPIRFS